MLFLTDRESDLAATSDDSMLVVHIDRPRPLAGPQSAIVCDVDLRMLASLERLSAVLKRYRTDPSITLTFLIRTPDPAAYAIANALGASEILSQPPSSGYRAKPLPIVADDEPSASVESHVRTVSGHLLAMFGAVTDNRGLSLANLQEGADTLVSAIKQTCIRDWVAIVRGYDDATYQHCLLVAGLTAAFAARLGLSLKSQHLVSQAALVHDIGKARVPHAILNKAGPLTPAEKDVMRKHPASGYYMIAYQKGIDPTILDIVRHHHEYLDGSGYPDGLRADEISELCRLVTICDIYAALIERRPYKQPTSPDDAFAILVDMGRKLDMRLVGAFRGLVDELSMPEAAAA